MLDVFYFKTLRIITVQFSDLFNEVVLRYYDENGDERDRITVPLAYSPRQAYIARLNRDTTDDETDTKLSLPRMSFEITSIQMDDSRQANKHNQIDEEVSGDPGETRLRQYAPTPYNINMRLSIHSKKINDSLQILEQILPYFSPDFNLVIEEVPEMGIVSDVPVILDRVNTEDNYQDGFNTSRLITWDLDFRIRGHIYPPIRDESVIREVTTNIRDDGTEEKLSSLVETAD